MWRRSLLTLALSLVVCTATRADEMVVIVHPERGERLRLSDIAQIYLKQRRFWKGGDAIIPVNREAMSQPRETFSRLVYGGASRNLVAYWNRQYFRGILPPITFASAKAIRRYIATEPRAVGYIPADLVDDSVRVVYRFE